MESRVLLLISVGELLLIGALMLILPRIARRGLLFGAYVGSQAAIGEEARRITRSWYRGMLAVVLFSVALAITLALTLETKSAMALANGLPQILLLGGFVLCYVRAYRAARRLAPAAPPPLPGVATITPAGPARLLPTLTMLAGAAIGLFSIGYAWWHYDLLPGRVPTHFGMNGQPDAWAARSPGAVLTLPLTTFIAGVGMGALGFLVATAKRAVRADDGGVSWHAQLRFRTAMLRFLCGASVLVSLLLATLSVGSIRVGLGRAQGLSPLMWVFTGALMLYCFVGVVYIALRIGQGGAKLEASVAHAPLTDGLANNAKWILGLFYVNRDDPSIFVEDRFGLGYTLNLGNRKAVAGFVVSLILITALPLLLLLWA